VRSLYLLSSLASLVSLSLLAACGADRSRVEVQAASFQAADVACTLEAQPIDRAAPARLVAIGDLHGDYDATCRALRRAGAIDKRNRWIGGAMGVVQLGDILDRGDAERAIIDLFERLEREAAAAGGSFTWLLGNHELMNAAGDFRYVTDGGWRDFDGGRANALGIGGSYRRIFAEQDVVVRVGGTLFSHAGVEPAWAGELPAVNRSTRCWLSGAGARPAAVSDTSGPVWTRAWGRGRVDCAALDRVLAAAGAERMVVGHTVQHTGITSACGGKLWRVDTGMSSHYRGKIQVLEIAGATAHPL
jgi:hypothetical protein